MTLLRDRLHHTQDPKPKRHIKVEFVDTDGGTCSDDDDDGDALNRSP